MRKGIILGIGLGLLLFINYTIYSKEQLLSQGQSVLLELAPVDPRSLMQGDYMALRFAIADAIRSASKTDDIQQGHVVIVLDDKRVGQFKRLDDKSPLAENEIRMRYHLQNKQIQFATDAFFFQEGHAEIYEEAEYGAFKVDSQGESVLTHMVDKNFQKLGFELQSMKE